MKTARAGKVLNIVVLVCVIIIFLGIVLFTLFVKDVYINDINLSFAECGEEYSFDVLLRKL